MSKLDYKKLGKDLKEHRISKGITTTILQYNHRLNHSVYHEIEAGRGGSKQIDTFFKYLDAIGGREIFFKHFIKKS